MTSQFNAPAVKAALRAHGLSQRAAARQLGYDPAYLSRVLSGEQAPSAALVSALDGIVRPVGASGGSEDAGYRPQFNALLAHDRKFGGDHVADAGLQLWRHEQGILDRTVDPEPDRVAAVAELAEVAGWLCYSAGRYAEARHAFSESLTLARHCGDLGMQWFATDMLAMVATAQGRPGEAGRLAGASMELSARVPGRVAVMSQVRRARALAMAGERTRSLAEMTRAMGGLEDSISDRDPVWAWWITPAEVAGHKGELLLALGQPGAAREYFHACVAAFAGEDRARGEYSYRVAELRALVGMQAWHDCETSLTGLAGLVGRVSSGMVRTRLDATLREIRRTAPSWVVDVAADVLREAESGV